MERNAPVLGRDAREFDLLFDSGVADFEGVAGAVSPAFGEDRQCLFCA